MLQIREYVPDEKLAKLEKKILRGGLLRFQSTPKKTFAIRKKLKPAVLDILNVIRPSMDETVNKHTVYVKNRRIQCNKSHYRRSQGDLFRITKYYYPNTTFKEFRTALFELANENRVMTLYCPTINKRVFLATGTGMARTRGRHTSIHSIEDKDELGLYLNVYTL
jgi:hypothetical protein